MHVYDNEERKLAPGQWLSIMFINYDDSSLVTKHLENIKHLVWLLVAERPDFTAIPTSVYLGCTIALGE
jgi:hypothetical protein